MLNDIKRRWKKSFGTIAFLTFVCGTVVFITLPGFLYFYFWEDAGFWISSFIGFLIGMFVLLTLDGIAAVCAGIGKLFRKSDAGRGRTGKTPD